LLPDPHFGWFTRVPARVGASDVESLEEFFQTVEFAESQGFDAIWMGEEHVNFDVIANFGAPDEVAESMQSLRDDLGLSGFQIDVGIYNLFSAKQVQD